MDCAQLIFFVLSIIFALYSLGLEYLEKEPEKNRDIDSTGRYRDEEDKSIRDLKTSNPKSTENGVRL